ncbi:PPR repeat family [Teratosphaeria destructans]|uniref:PPR repeat family n=1 Tax=Teratosphaeria destructans TaxID=418781 RepID=A0A9W7VXM8_9PEZI|nr:PPR repeat family [Teratosphaeria destructans]
MPPCPTIRSTVNSLVSRLASGRRQPLPPPTPRCELNTALRQQQDYTTKQQGHHHDDTYWFRPAFSKAAIAPQATTGRKKSIDYSAYEAVLAGDQDVSGVPLHGESLVPSSPESQQRVAPDSGDLGDAMSGMSWKSRTDGQHSAQYDTESTMSGQGQASWPTHSARAGARMRRSRALELLSLTRVRNPSAASLRRAMQPRSEYAIYKRNGVWRFQARPIVRRMMISLTMTDDQRRRAVINYRLRVQEREGRPLPLRFLSIATPSRETAIVSTEWTTQIARVSQFLNSNSLLQLHRRKWRVLSLKTRTLARLILNHIRESDGRLVMADLELLAKRLGTTTNELWAAITLWKLVHHPLDVAASLLNTHATPYPPINWVEDCLQTAAIRIKKLITLSNQQRRIEALKLLKALPKLVARDTEQFVEDSSLVATLMPYASVGVVHEIWDLIKAGKLRVTWQTHNQLAHWFEKRNFPDKALDAILKANKAGLSENSDTFLQFCSRLLRRSMAQKEGLRMTLRLVENLVGIGVKLNRQLCNIVMLNAVEAGDEETMSAVHRSAIEQGLEPNEYTHAILLKACKQDISNGDRLREVIQGAIVSGHVRENAVVATEILHCLALHHTRQIPKKPSDDPYRPVDRAPTFAAVNAVLEAYCQLFDPTPLERIGIAVPRARAPDPSYSRLRPPPHAITVVMAVYLEQPLRGELVAEWYTRFRQLAEGGDKDLLACLASEHLSNIFLRKFCMGRKTLLHASTVIKDMRRPLDPTLLSTHGIQQASPGVYTWTIFLEGLARHGQTKLAEQVMTYMRKQGIEPNDVTWTSLLGVYTRAQDVEKVIDTLRRMDASGVAMSEWSHEYLKAFRDKSQLRHLLAKPDHTRSLDFTGDIRQGLADKIRQAGSREEGGHGWSATDELARSSVVEGGVGDRAGESAHIGDREVAAAE